MSPLSICLLLLTLQLLLAICKVIWQELYIELETGYALEFLASAANCVALYLWLFSVGVSPGPAWLLAIAMGVIAFLFSWVVPYVMDLLFFIGEDNGLGPNYPLFTAWLTFFLFWPSCLASYFEPEWFYQEILPIYVAMLVGEFFLFILLFAVDFFFDQPPTKRILDYFFNTLLVIAAYFWIIPGNGDDLAWVLSSLFALTLGIAALGLHYFAAVMLELIEFEPRFWRQRLHIFALQLVIVFGLYSVPIFFHFVQGIKDTLAKWF